MISLSVAEIARAIGARVVGACDDTVEVTDVEVDSRAARRGSLFVALPGERVDGHNYVGVAFARGATAAVTARELPHVGGCCLVVDDPLVALGRLARHVVDRARAGGLRVVAITGSQGKTSTKDLLAQILEGQASTIAPYGNLNNELGVPLTALRVTAETRYLVVEMGARGVGHIAYLCGLTPPQLGLVLNVGHAHVGEFGSQAAIAQAKGELVEALPADGVALLNADDPLVWSMRSRTTAPTIAFSASGPPRFGPAVWASDVRSDSLGRCRFQLHSSLTDSPSRVEIHLQVTGRHQVANALAAAAAALVLGVDLAGVAHALNQTKLRSGARMELHERADEVLVINDAYNANPESAQAALETLAEVGRTRRGRHRGAKTWAVLGDMLELGDSAVLEHEALGRHVGELGVDRLVAVGAYAPVLAAAAAAAGLSAPQIVVLTDKAGVAGQVLPFLSPGDTVLVKASRGLALDTVAAEIWMAPRSAEQQPGRAEHSEDPA